MSNLRPRLCTVAALAALALTVAGCSTSVDVTLPSAASTTAATSPTSSSPSSSTSSSSEPSSTSSAPTSASGTPTAEDLVQQISANFNSAKSAHLHASYIKDDETRTLDIVGTTDGSNQRTVLTINKNNVQAEIRTVAARVYVNGNAAYYQYSGASSSRAKQVANRWLSIPLSTAASMTKDFALGTIFTDLKSNISKSKIAGLTVTASTHNGQKVWRAANGRTTIVAAADGSGRLISASNDGLLNKQTYTFDQWDAAPTVDAPSNPITT